MPCFLGIDYGTKRIGLAVSDSDASIASPLAVIEVRGNLAEHTRAVVAAAREYEVDAFVVGLPKNMDGTESRQAKITRNFADELARTGSKPVHFWDERLSSFTAQELLQLRAWVLLNQLYNP